MRKSLLFTILLAFFFTGCAHIYTPLGMYVKNDAPFEVMVYGHKTDREPTNAFIEGLKAVGSVAGGAVLLNQGLSSAGFTVIETASIVLDRQNRDRYEARLRADAEMAKHILAVLVVPDPETAQAKMLVITDLDPTNPQVKETVTNILK